MRRVVVFVLATVSSAALATTFAGLPTASAASSASFCSALSADGGANAFAQAAASGSGATALATSAEQLAKESPSKTIKQSLATMAKLFDKLGPKANVGALSSKDATKLSTESTKLSSYASAHCASTSPPATSATGLSGSWSGTYSGASDGTFTLNWQQSGSNLVGSIVISDFGDGQIPINGTVNGATITFGTVGTNALTYTGTVSGSSMSGTWKAPIGGGSWSATKSS